MRFKILPILCGVALMIFGCSRADLATGSAKLANTYDTKISPAATQAANSVGQVAGVVAVAAPGTTVGNIAGIVAALSGILLTVNELIKGGLHTVANQLAQPAVIASVNPPSTGPPKT